ncbi:MAG: 2'-deoxycytidine 5'-triphosphate deaminase [Nanoarchaeota archaeon]
MTEILSGILPDWRLSSLVDNIQNNSQVQPASYEPYVLEEAWEVKAFGSLTPSIRRENRIRKIKNIKTEDLKKDKIYEIQFAETFSIPPAFFAKVSPKSSIGRTGTYVLTYTDDGKYINHSPFGYNGKFFAYLQPRSFNILLEDTKLVQLRFQTIDAKLKENELRREWEKEPLLRDLEYNLPIPQSGVEFNLDGLVLKAFVKEKSVYAPKENFTSINLMGHNYAEAYWTNPPIINNSLLAKEGVTYILGSMEGMVTPPYLAAELREYTEAYMSFHQAHIAGFIDPGFGYKHGNSLTFEFTPYSPMTIRHGQPLGVIDYFRMLGQPKKIYSGSYANSSKARLGKCFVYKENAEQTPLDKY